MTALTSGGTGHGPRPLPIRPRPVTGESTGSYIRRLARANYLRPSYLRRYLTNPKDGSVGLELLAILAGRSLTALEHALTDPGQHQGAAPPRRRAGPERQAGKATLFTVIRQDARERGLSGRALADLYGVHRRTVRQALQSPVPAPRKPLPPRKSRLEPFKEVIQDMLREDHDDPHPSRRTVTSIMNTLIAEHQMTGISYQMVRDYVASQRGSSRRLSPANSGTAPPTLSPRSARRTPAMTWSPAHLAVEQQDLPQLRDLLDAGHDIEDDDGHGWTLLRHAIDVEQDSHAQAGEPLHADVTAFLLARGADPLRPCNGMTVVTEAEIRGHWLAAEIMRAWIKRGQESAAT